MAVTLKTTSALNWTVCWRWEVHSAGFVARQALVDGYASKSSNDPAIKLQPVLATLKSSKLADKLKGRLGH